MSPRQSDNNFDALRFWAALAVLWSHAFPITETSEQNEPLFKWSGGQTTLGTIAVACFFTISGFLITRSFERAADPWRFFRARFLRIMPALLVVLVLVAFVVGPTISALSWQDYFLSREPYRYFTLHATFWRFTDELPGVFVSNPTPCVNGSLWTLRYEVECYALIFLLGVTRLLHRNVTAFLYLGMIIYLGIHDQGHVSNGEDLPSPNQHLDLGAKFLAGTLIYQWRVPLEAKAAGACAAVALVCLALGDFATASRTVVPYLVMYLAIGTSIRLPNMARWGDLSYGIYIYAWPVTQLVVMHTTTPHWLTSAAIATPIVLLLALLSWHAVEKRALSLKDAHRRQGRAEATGSGLMAPASGEGAPIEHGPTIASGENQHELI